MATAATTEKNKAAEFSADNKHFAPDSWEFALSSRDGKKNRGGGAGPTIIYVNSKKKANRMTFGPWSMEVSPRVDVVWVKPDKPGQRDMMVAVDPDADGHLAAACKRVDDAVKGHLKAHSRDYWPKKVTDEFVESVYRPVIGSSDYGERIKVRVKDVSQLKVIDARGGGAKTSTFEEFFGDSTEFKHLHIGLEVSFSCVWVTGGGGCGIVVYAEELVIHGGSGASAGSNESAISRRFKRPADADDAADARPKTRVKREPAAWTLDSGGNTTMKTGADQVSELSFEQLTKQSGAVPTA